MSQRLVSFHYTLKNAAGEVLDSSSGGEAMKYIEGQRSIISGLEDEIKKLKTGDKKSVKIVAKEAYGEYDAKLKMKVGNDQLPKEHKVKVGDQFRVDMEDQPRVFTVTEVKADHVLMDGNHPLAGQDLFFDVEITDAHVATEEELKEANTHVHGEGCDHGHEGHDH